MYQPRHFNETLADVLHAQPRSPYEAPAQFAERLIKAVVGIKIVVTELSGKFQLSQNQRTDNQAGVPPRK